MSPFLRAFCGEFWALFRRRNFRNAWILILVGVFLRTLWAWLSFGASGELDGLAANHQNFWPRFGQAAGFGFVLAELATIVLLGGALPREVGMGAVRDPLCRRISRFDFLSARAGMALFIPLFFGVTVVGSASLSASIFFDGGHVITDPVLLDPDPEGEAAFEAWLSNEGIRADQLAAELDDDPDWEIPDEFYAFIPLLIAKESEIRNGILSSLQEALLPLAALGLLAFLMSILLPTGALASGVALGAVLTFGVFLAPEMGDRAWWVFADWLPGMGTQSPLGLATHFADGYTDIPPLDPAALGIGRLGSLFMCVFSYGLGILVFLRKKL